MAYKLSTKQRSSMFKAFCEKQANTYVAKKCKVSHTTVTRYRKIDKWDDRWEAIQQRARAKAAVKDARTIAKMIENVSDIRANITKRLLSITEADDSKMTVWDLDKIVRLEQFIKGHPDARTEIVESPIDFLAKMIREFDQKQKGG